MKLTYTITTFFLVAMFLTLQVFGVDASMRDLSSLNDIQSVFQKDAGKVKIIALLSPT